MTPKATSRKRGRPPGKFKYQTGLLYDILKQRSPCHLTDKELADLLRVGDRQVSSYLRLLKSQGAISISSRNRPVSKDKRDVWVNHRTIDIVEEHR